jgi:hypothetical protein
MKTAVEWLEEMLTISLGEHHMSLFINEFNKAKKMEKEHIENSFYHGVELTKIRVESIIDEADFEDYYNETFKQQEQ